MNQSKNIVGNKKNGVKGSSMNPKNRKAIPKRNNNKQNNKVNGQQKQSSVAVAYSSQQMGTQAVVKQGKDSVTIVHREFLGNISGGATSAFTSAFVIACNPGIVASFPWLATIAQNWETYMFKKLRYCSYTRTGSNTVGSIVMAPDYDASDSDPASEQIMSAYQDVVEGAPWRDMFCQLRPSAMHPEGKRKYIRTGTLASNLDIKTYDVANLYVNTVDSNAAGSWSKLWVEYEVTLYTPQASSSLPVGIAGGRLQGATSMTGALPFGTAGAVDAQAVGFSYSGTTGLITFEKVGTYVMTLNIIGTVITAFPAAVLSGCTSIVTANSIDSGALTAKYLLAVNATSSNATVQITATATTVTASGLYIGCAPLSSFA